MLHDGIHFNQTMLRRAWACAQVRTGRARNGVAAAVRCKRGRPVMGYTHYWYAAPELPQRQWDRMVADFVRLSHALHSAGLRLAGANGAGAPVVNGDVVEFNGVDRCGHEEGDLGIAWPADNASGIRPGMGWKSGASSVSGKWFFGAKLAERACGGSCMHEGFVLARTMPDNGIARILGKYAEYTTNGRRSRTPSSRVGKYFDCCKTAYKPYDLAVSCALLIAKRHMGALLVVASDGDNDQWADTRMTCQHFLGYGQDMVFGKRSGEMLRAGGSRTPKMPDGCRARAEEEEDAGAAPRYVPNFRTMDIPMCGAADSPGDRFGGSPDRGQP